MYSPYFFDPWVHEFFCKPCRARVVILSDVPVKCPRCGREATFRFVVTWPPPQFPVDIRVAITHAGETKPYFDSSMKPSKSADGTTSMVWQEFDRSDPKKQHHRYRKKVVKADGTVAKDVDVALTSNEGHGNVGRLKHPPPPSNPGNPMRIKLDVGELRPWIRFRPSKKTQPE